MDGNNESRKGAISIYSPFAHGADRLLVLQIELDLVANLQALQQGGVGDGEGHGHGGPAQRRDGVVLKGEALFGGVDFLDDAEAERDKWR